MPAFVTTRSPVFILAINCFWLFLPLFLWPDHHEIHDDENENERHKEADAAGRTACRSGGLCLSQEGVEHIIEFESAP